MISRSFPLSLRKNILKITDAVGDGCVKIFIFIIFLLLHHWWHIKFVVSFKYVKISLTLINILRDICAEILIFCKNKNLRDLHAFIHVVNYRIKTASSNYGCVNKGLTSEQSWPHEMPARSAGRCGRSPAPKTGQWSIKFANGQRFKTINKQADGSRPQNAKLTRILSISKNYTS